ncbi:phosphoribosylglycinamide formyltransferase [Flavobacterium arcticum]|uniref:Phosphoribosylglycinamide formyltransferase n=1 Tax=Flavobacterium arcticum TaxID=1784713 RepID=A0A345HBN7_9FLAO|nr:phosphoribosylglycinamide formyltransferase [Flavobacterium arcticum]AXG73997.1 phosphoribosylglycinamide formyltransferase [Flavobacterium arcticum]KAF2508975.1 phosphoribosylglycinamide formyltransferase [Flavobacterium arcticum]
MKKTILFASGSGSNAAQIIQYAQQKNTYTVAAIFTNNPNAGVIEKAKNYGVPTVIFTREELNNGLVLQKINEISPSLIVLAGFLWKFPSDIIATYPQKVINIHPALLPNYGGKGMYGIHVHRAVLENKEAESGITIHYVNDNYDEGNVILQKSVNVQECETPEDVAAKVLTLEHKHLPMVVEELLIKTTT